MLDDPTWNGQPTPKAILSDLDARFEEMLRQYSVAKSKLPSCLVKAIDRMLDDLKTKKARLRWIWSLTGIPWIDLPSAEGQGQTLNASAIRIWNAYKQKHYCGGNKSGLTAGLMFHELIHAARRKHPECFKPLDHEKEESSTEDATNRLFGEANVCTPYKTYYGFPPFPATYQNLCDCGPCPK